MSKFNSKILKIKLFYLRLSGKIKQSHFQLNTGNPIKNIKSVLIIFPTSEEDFNVAKYCLKSLFSSDTIKYTYLVNNVFV